MPTWQVLQTLFGLLSPVSSHQLPSPCFLGSTLLSIRSGHPPQARQGLRLMTPPLVPVLLPQHQRPHTLLRDLHLALLSLQQLLLPVPISGRQHQVQQQLVVLLLLPQMYQTLLLPSLHSRLLVLGAAQLLLSFPVSRCQHCPPQAAHSLAVLPLHPPLQPPQSSALLHHLLLGHMTQ